MIGIWESHRRDKVNLEGGGYKHFMTGSTCISNWDYLIPLTRSILMTSC
ncbi:hypothetical protein ACJIZ3_002627 [Penstemon smallii]|uniref:Uncharacterized protein n=1 Tax=Penstemon smallii TaxID=265156 RepID=A0ABD3U6Y4_9LAMI